MNILVLGGTRYFGVHLVNELLKNKHDVTIATRGIAKDSFGDNVKRIMVDRTNAEDLKDKLSKHKYDVAYDNINYCSNDTKALLDAVNTDRYIVTSTGSVYDSGEMFFENDYNPFSHKLNWCNRSDYPYDEVKRQMECAVFTQYKVPTVAVRFPIVLGIDDYTKRLYFYVEHIINGTPMNIIGDEYSLSFIQSNEAGKFLAYLCNLEQTGSVNAANIGTVKTREIIEYIEKKTGKKALISDHAESAPFNLSGNFVLSTKKAEEWGYKFNSLDSFLYKLIDDYILMF